MKIADKKGRSLIVAAVALVVASACDDKRVDFGSGTGRIALELVADPSVVSDRAASSRAGELSDLQVSDLTLQIESEDGAVSKTFSGGALPPSELFPVGNYTLSASYGDPELEGFEAPALYGSTQLTVNEDQTTPVELTASFSKAMVTILFDPSLTGSMAEVGAVVRGSGGTPLEYAASESRPAYVKEGKVSIDLDFTKPGGSSASVAACEFNAKAKHHYKVTLALGGEGYGSQALVVKFDELLQDSTVTVDLRDIMTDYPAPETTASGFTNGQTFRMVQGDPIEAAPRIDIQARAGIKSAVLTTSGPYFCSATGWPAEIDLANASEQMQQKLIELGLKDMGLFRNPGKFAAVDFSGVIPNMPPEGTAVPATEFSLVVTDRKGQQSKPLSFKVKIEELLFALKPTGTLYNGSPTVKVFVHYNGSIPLEDAVVFEYLNTRGTWSQTSINKINKTGTIYYTVAVNLPGDAKAGPVVIRARCGNSISDEISIESVAPPTLRVIANDVYATSAWLAVAHDDIKCSALEIQVFASTDNGATYTALNGVQQGAEINVTGLKPNTKYTFRATVGRMNSTTATATTEAAVQIPNSNFDVWTSTTHTAAAANCIEFHPGEPWKTNNHSTTAKWIWAGTSYSAVSGVAETTDCKSGGKAALVRTVGGNQATLFQGPSKYAAGVLMLGADNSGYEISSRPAALGFWYKYIRYKNDDRGYVEVSVLDANDNVIASGTRNVSDAANFTYTSVSLNYNRGAAKAAKIKVKIMSTSAPVDENSTTHHNNDYSYGAKFTVDEITLSY